VCLKMCLLPLQRPRSIMWKQIPNGRWKRSPRTRASLSRRLKVLTIPIRTEQKGDDVVGATEAEVHHIGRDIV